MPAASPQAVRVRALPSLLDLPERDSFTDLLSWGEAAGIAGHLVEASGRNIKITTRVDLEYAEFLIDDGGPPPRM